MNEIAGLREYQKRSKARIEETAHSVGVTSRTIYNWINGDVKRIHPLQLHRLRLFLNRKNQIIESKIK